MFIGKQPIGSDSSSDSPDKTSFSHAVCGSKVNPNTVREGSLEK